MDGDRHFEGISRRRFIRDAGLLGAIALANPAGAPAATNRRRRARQTVAILGGGVAGLTAAHELAERGFDVTVYERRAWGGKARSIPVPRSAAGGRRELPGEHGFRIEFGWYHNLPDTMRRIPVPGNEHGVHDNLVAAGDWLLERDGGREGLHTLLVGPIEPLTVDVLRRELVAALELGVNHPPDEAAFLARQIAIFMTSSDERRFGQWENVSWWDFLRAAEMSSDYQRIWARGLSEIPAALKAHNASSRTVGGYGEASLLNRMGRGADGPPDRVLNAPTNEAWIDPWIAHLRDLGVRLRLGATVEALRVHGGRIRSATIRDGRGERRDVEADWFVCALPVEVARRLWSPAIVARDPRLAALSRLETAWLTGIQFFLRRELPITHSHVGYVDSPWGIASVSQAQFWPGRDFARDYGDGTVRDCLSATIGRWDEPGIVYGKHARQCTRDEIGREVWEQIKAHLEDTGRERLSPDLLHSWFLDPGIRWGHDGRPRNDDPFFQNTVGSWAHRPETATAIPNLMLAGDYVRTGVDVATMESANESGRAAANAILVRSGSSASPVRVYERYRAPELEHAKRLDAERYRRGLPHLLDTPWPPQWCASDNPGL